MTHSILETPCACQGSNIDAVAPETVLEALGKLDMHSADPLPDILAAVANGEGMLADAAPAGNLQAVDMACEDLQAGDVLIVRDLFDETDPQIEVIGLSRSADMAAAEFIESDGSEDVTVLRGDGEFWQGIAAAVLPSAVSSLVGGAATAAGNAIGSLVTDPTLPVRNTLNTVQTAYQTANQALDLGGRLVGIGQTVRNAFKGLDFSAADYSNTSAYTPPGAQWHTSRYTFKLKCRDEPGGSYVATFPFQVVLKYNCFSIERATITHLQPQISGYKPHELKFRAQAPSGGLSQSTPPQGSFTVDVVWDPADVLGRVKEQARGWVTIKADGTVSVSGFSTSMITLVPAVRRSRERNNCAAVLGRFNSGGGRSPGIVPPQPSRRPSSGQSRPTGAARQPRNGKHIYFGSGRASSTGEVRALVQQWWASLRPNLQAAVRNGTMAVKITGHADPTGRESSNRALSHRRASLVAGMVRALAGGRAKVHFQGLGSDAARRAGVPAGRSDRSWRRVTIALDTIGRIQ